MSDDATTEHLGPLSLDALRLGRGSDFEYAHLRSCAECREGVALLRRLAHELEPASRAPFEIPADRRRAILANAKGKLHAPHRLAAPSLTRRELVPVAIAASLLIGMGLEWWYQRLDDALRQKPAPASTARREPATEPAPRAPREVAPVPAPEVLPALPPNHSLLPTPAPMPTRPARPPAVDHVPFHATVGDGSAYASSSQASPRADRAEIATVNESDTSSANSSPSTPAYPSSTYPTRSDGWSGSTGYGVKIKLATLAPQGSAWENLLVELGEKWTEQSKDTGTPIGLKVYAGGLTGDEGDTVKKMRVGQVQAAALTVVGLRDIDPGTQAASVPGLLGSDAETNYVLERMEPVWEKRLLDKDYVVLAWGDAGWIRFFAKKPLRSPADAAGLKVFAWAGDPAAVEAWKAAGFQPVVFSATDMMSGLTTGMIEGFTTSAIMANASRWYEKAHYMTDVPWGRLLTAMLVKKETWEKINPDLRPKLLETARRFGKRIDAEVGKLESDSLVAMEKDGLEVVGTTAEERVEWARFAEKSWPSIRGAIVPEDQFDDVARLRDEYRAKNGKSDDPR